MTTPIYDFIKKYNESGAVRLHMPGHKGKTLLGCEDKDITEIAGADVLYCENGIIFESEQNARRIFGSALTLYSTEGSSLSIRAMVHMTVSFAAANGSTARILAGRNAHKTFVTATALMGVDVDWLWNRDGEVLGCEIDLDELDAALSREKYTAVYVTSPDYLGSVLDIAGIARVCHAHGAMLLVDNAHGAYLKFLDGDMHPLTLGADMCCDSAHKTLPALTGAAYLHVSDSAPKFFCDCARVSMSLFASTSPSYLILQSLDLVNKELLAGYRERLAQKACEVEQLQKRLMEAGFDVCSQEPLKLVIRTKKYGYEGTEIADALGLHGLVCEFADRDFAVLMITPEIDAGQLDRLERVLISLPRRAPIALRAPRLSHTEQVISPTKAIYSPSQRCAAEESEGKVLAYPISSCPPAVCIGTCGERVSKQMIECMKYYGIDECTIICD